MAAWFDGIEVYVELSWGDGPRTAIASMAWTDYADDVVSIDVSRGSQSEFGDFPPGTATIVINDPGRVFDASNTAGPNYGEVVPMVPVRIRAVAGATSAALFLGYVASFALSWPVDGRAPVCVLTCVDGTRVLEAARLAESAFEAEILADSPSHYWPLQGDTLDAVGVVDLIDAPDDTRDALTAGPEVGFPLGASGSMSGGRSAGEISELTLPESIEVVAMATTSQTSSIQARVALATDSFFALVVVNAALPSVGVYYSDPTTNRRLGSTGVKTTYIPWPSTTYAHLVASLDGSDIILYRNGAVVATLPLQAGTGTLTTTSVMPGVSLLAPDVVDTSVGHFATYPSALSAAQVAAHYDAGLHAFGHPYGDGGGTRTGRILDAISHPSADRDIDAGSTVLDAWLPAGGDALSVIRETIAPEQALVYFSADGKAVWRSRNWQRTATEAATVQATFGDQTGEIRYTDDLRVRRSVDDIYNHTTVSYNDGSVSVEDATSIAAYGEQRESISATLIDDTHTARQLAAMRVREHKDAADRIEALTVLPRRDTETVVATLLELDLGYRVAVNRRPIGGTGSMALEMSVRGITHHIDRSAVGWVSTLYLAPPMTSYEDGPWLTLGDADYGKIGPGSATLDGTSGCYLSTPDAAALDITGDLEMVVLVAADDWTPAAAYTLAAKYVPAGNNRSYQFALNTTGKLILQHWSDGSTGKWKQSTAAVSGVSNGDWLWVKVTLDVDNGAAGFDIKFYTAAYAGDLVEPSSWTQLGSTVTTAGTSSVYAGTAPLEVGSHGAGTGSPFAGSVARVIVRNGIAGTIVFDFDAGAIATHGQATVVDQSVNAATITANGTARLHPANLIPY